MLVEPGEGVGGGVVGADLEVEVAGGAGAVIADVGDVLSGAYLVPNLDEEAVAVHVATGHRSPSGRFSVVPYVVYAAPC